MKLKSIYHYPLKGTKGTALKSATVDDKGIVGDRHWMLVDKHNQFISQRTHPKLALVAFRMLENGDMEIHAPGMPSLPILNHTFTADRLSVQVWSDTCSAILVSEEADQWCSSFLNDRVRMVYMDEQCTRKVDPEYGQHQDHVSFADGYPLLIVTEASLEDLNSRLSNPVPVNRFRPNFVISGAEAYEEDHWRMLQIGDLLVECVKPCARCQVVTIDQDTGVSSKEPMKTLATYRKKQSKVFFGQNAIPRKGGRVHVGDEVLVVN